MKTMMKTKRTTTSSNGRFELSPTGIIVTKFLSPTNHRGSRVKATSGSGKTLTMAWNYENDPLENHACVAATLAAELFETTTDGVAMRGGSLGDGKYAFFVSPLVTAGTRIS